MISKIFFYLFISNSDQIDIIDKTKQSPAYIATGFSCNWTQLTVKAGTAEYIDFTVPKSHYNNIIFGICFFYYKQYYIGSSFLFLFLTFL